jgi:hypothetical protein
MQLQNTLEIENINLYERSTPIKVAKGEVTASQDMQDGLQCLNLKKKNQRQYLGMKKAWLTNCTNGIDRSGF